MFFIPLYTLEVVRSQNKLIYWVMRQTMGKFGFKGLFGVLNLRTSSYSRGFNHSQHASCLSSKRMPRPRPKTTSSAQHSRCWGATTASVLSLLCEAQISHSGAVQTTPPLQQILGNHLLMNSENKCVMPYRSVVRGSGARRFWCSGVGLRFRGVPVQQRRLFIHLWEHSVTVWTKAHLHPREAWGNLLRTPASSGWLSTDRGWRYFSSALSCV